MRFFYLAVIGCAICSASALQARAGAFLMSTTGAGTSNANRASLLGYSVTANDLPTIVGMTQADLAAYKVVWANPYLDGTAYYFLTKGVKAGGSLEQYVYNGGTLVLNVAGNNGSMTDVAPGGVDFVGGTPATSHNSEVFRTPGHLYLNGSIYGGVNLAPENFADWKDTDHGYLNVADLAALMIKPAIVLEWGYGCGPTFIQYDYGCGTVIVTTLSYGWGTEGARQNPQDNLIKYALYASTQTSCDCNCTPEPSSFALFGLGACFGAFGLVRRRSCGVA